MLCKFSTNIENFKVISSFGNNVLLRLAEAIETEFRKPLLHVDATSQSLLLILVALCCLSLLLFLIFLYVVFVCGQWERGFVCVCVCVCVFYWMFVCAFILYMYMISSYSLHT